MLSQRLAAVINFTLVKKSLAQTANLCRCHDALYSA